VWFSAVPERGSASGWTVSQQEVAELYAAARGGVYRSLIMMGVDPARAQEATQEAFLRLYVELSDGGLVENPRAWVYRAAHNVALDWIARQSRESGWSDVFVGTLISPHISAEQELIDQESAERVQQAIQSLSMRQRLCLEMRAQGMQYQEIAEALQVRPSTVGEFLRRAIRRLRKSTLCDQQH